MAVSERRKTGGCKSIVASHSVFDGLNDRYLDRIAQSADFKTLEKGSTLMVEGDPADRFSLIIKGTVAVQATLGAWGQASLEKVSDNDIVGWSWLVPPHRYLFNAITLVPSDVMVFDALRLREECELDHEFGYEMLKRISQLISHRLRAARMKILAFY